MDGILEFIILYVFQNVRSSILNLLQLCSLLDRNLMISKFLFIGKVVNT